MATDVLVKIMPGGLRCVNEAESSKLHGLYGREVSARISQPRNLKFHKKYFQLLHVARDMADQDYTTEQFRALCIAGAGYCDFIQGRDGMIAVPRSMSFGAMDEITFNRLYQDTLTFICQRWDLEQHQLNQLVDFM